jgi:hypothetical protein
MKLTVLFEPPFWVGIFEREDNGKYSVARAIFGSEPKLPEIFNFVLQHIDDLKFSTPQKDAPVEKKMNPKRLQREVKKEMQKVGVMQKAQDAMRIELEMNKKIRKEKSKEQREAEKQAMFEFKQSKKKKKLRGH